MIQIRKYILLTVALFALTTAMAQDLEDSIKVHYRLEESKLDLSYKNNGITLDSLARILNIRNADTTNILQQVYIIGRASPEGNWDFNYRLSQKRAASMLEHLNKITEIPDSLITSKHIVQDWNLLLYLVERDSAVPYQNEVIELIRQYKGEETNAAPNTTLFNKLRSFKNGVPYRYIYKNLFPELRISTVVVAYNREPEPIVEEPEPEPEPDTVIVEPVIPDTIVTDTVAEIQQPIEVEKERKPLYMALKTNLLYDVALVPNIGAEYYIGNNISITGGWHYAWWNNKTKYWRTYGGELGARYWFGSKAMEKPLQGHHAGLYGQAVTYDFLAFGNKGYMSGNPGKSLFNSANYVIGLEYGYSLPIAKRLNMDFVVGVGYHGGKYNEYKLQDSHYVWQALHKRSFFGPTKAEISLVWLLGYGNTNNNKKGGL